MRNFSLSLCCFLLVACNAETTGNNTSGSEAAESTSGIGKYPVAKQYAWIERSKDGIRAQLKDPDSAKFRDVSFYSGGAAPVACGQVNAKTGFGGYGGFERFIAAGETMAVLESQVSDDIGLVWDKVCRHGPEDEAHTD